MSIDARSFTALRSQLRAEGIHLSDQKLGSGSFSVVFKGHVEIEELLEVGEPLAALHLGLHAVSCSPAASHEPPSRYPVAIKIVHGHFREKGGVPREILLQLALSGQPGILPILYFTELQGEELAGCCSVIVTPFIPSESFGDLLKKGSISVIRCYMRELCKALASLEKFGILHRDIKPKNFLFDARMGAGFLTDFGLASTQEEVLQKAYGLYAGPPAGLGSELAAEMGVVQQGQQLGEVRGDARAAAVSSSSATFPAGTTFSEMLKQRSNSSSSGHTALKLASSAAAAATASAANTTSNNAAAAGGMPAYASLLGRSPSITSSSSSSSLVKSRSGRPTLLPTVMRPGGGSRLSSGSATALFSSSSLGAGPGRGAADDPLQKLVGSSKLAGTSGGGKFSQRERAGEGSKGHGAAALSTAAGGGSKRPSKAALFPMAEASGGSSASSRSTGRGHQPNLLSSSVTAASASSVSTASALSGQSLSAFHHSASLASASQPLSSLSSESRTSAHPSSFTSSKRDTDRQRGGGRGGEAAGARKDGEEAKQLSGSKRGSPVKSGEAGRHSLEQEEASMPVVQSRGFSKARGADRQGGRSVLAGKRPAEEDTEGLEQSIIAAAAAAATTSATANSSAAATADSHRQVGKGGKSKNSVQTAAADNNKLSLPTEKLVEDDLLTEEEGDVHMTEDGGAAGSLAHRGARNRANTATTVDMQGGGDDDDDDDRTVSENESSSSSSESSSSSDSSDSDSWVLCSRGGGARRLVMRRGAAGQGAAAVAPSLLSSLPPTSSALPVAAPPLLAAQSSSFSTALPSSTAPQSAFPLHPSLQRLLRQTEGRLKQQVEVAVIKGRMSSPIPLPANHTTLSSMLGGMGGGGGGGGAAGGAMPVSSSLPASSSRSRHPVLAGPIRADRAGTPGYRSPEVLLNCPFQTTAIDVWSAGAILACLLMQRHPLFAGPDDAQHLHMMLQLFGARLFRAAAHIGRPILFSPQRLMIPVSLQRAMAQAGLRGLLQQEQLLQRGLQGQVMRNAVQGQRGGQGQRVALLQVKDGGRAGGAAAAPAVTAGRGEQRSSSKSRSSGKKEEKKADKKEEKKEGKAARSSSSSSTSSKVKKSDAGAHKAEKAADAALRSSSSAPALAPTPPPAFPAVLELGGSSLGRASSVEALLAKMPRSRLQEEGFAEAFDLLVRMLDPHPFTRISGAVALLKHPFLNPQEGPARTGLLRGLLGAAAAAAGKAGERKDKEKEEKERKAPVSHSTAGDAVAGAGEGNRLTTPAGEEKRADAAFAAGSTAEKAGAAEYGGGSAAAGGGEHRGASAAEEEDAGQSPRAAAKSVSMSRARGNDEDTEENPGAGSRDLDEEDEQQDEEQDEEGMAGAPEDDDVEGSESDSESVDSTQMSASGGDRSDKEQQQQEELAADEDGTVPEDEEQLSYEV